jgi:ATP-dependent RNA helicase RhlE
MKLTTFESLGLSERILKQLAQVGLTTPTPIQEQAIPLVLAGRDVMGLAQTGTGKTAAFGLPLVHILMKVGVKPAPKTVRSLILAPTRELVNQIAEHLRAYTAGSHLKVGIVVGGVSINPQIERLARGTDILIATPGRLLDLLDRRAVSLSQTEFLVLDEADQMLDLGFVHALRKIAALLKTPRQTMLFSATMPKLMAELSQNYLNDPVRVQVSAPGKAADKITQSVHFIAQSEKSRLLVEYLGRHKGEQALVFSRTKHGAEKLMKQVDAAGFPVSSIHGNKSQGQRERALQSFRDGRLQVLVATDVAARGIDIAGVRHVYNYDLPNVPENYIHRIGRTARAGAAGAAVAFCAPAEMKELRAIEKIMKLPIPVGGGSPWHKDDVPADVKPGNGNWRKRSGGRPPQGAPKANTNGSGGRRRRRAA